MALRRPDHTAPGAVAGLATVRVTLDAASSVVMSDVAMSTWRCRRGREEARALHGAFVTHGSRPPGPRGIPAPRYVPSDADTQVLYRVLPLPPQTSGARSPAPESEPPADSTDGILRSSAIMAAGTLASRITGFGRTAILVAALGTHALGDTFNTANTIPNIVYQTLLGGVLTAAHVPLLVRARARSARYGEEFEQRLFSLLMSGLLLLTVIATLAGPLLIRLYASGFSAAQDKLATLFVLFFMPQIFFFGFSAVAGASLNARSRFAATVWTPVLNNVVVIAACLVFLSVTTGPVSSATISNGEITLIGLGTTAGVAIQAIALIPSLRHIGFNWRPRFDFQPGELKSMGTIAGWTLALVLAQQVGLLVYTNIANTAGARGLAQGIRYGVGLTPWANAYQFFQLPFAIVAVSVITALFPKISASAAEKRWAEVVDDLASGLRLSLIIIVPSAAMLFGFSAEICVVFFAHGATKVADALVIAEVLQVFAVALIPFAAQQILQRGFYALADTRTPAVIGMLTTLISIGLAIIGFEVLPTRYVVLGIAFAQGVAWTIACLVTAELLRRRLGSLHGRAIATPVLKAGVASILPLALPLAIHEVLVHRIGETTAPALVALVVGGTLSVALFVLGARLLRIEEIDSLGRTFAGRLPFARRRGGAHSG
jgi:putative peptidoglycan lipid II flippase